jgi:hypothetical protein
MPEVPISRPTPPRAEDYAVVAASQGPRRDFRISVGLREGWDAEGRVFDWPLVTRTERDFVGHSGDAWRQQGVGFGA